MEFNAVLGELPYLLKGTFPTGPLEGAALTLIISAVSALLAFVIGVICGSYLILRKGLDAKILGAVLAFLLSIPVVMLLFWTFFLLPNLLGIHVPATATVIITLSLIFGAYVALIVYAGLQAIDPDQWNAGLSLGLTPFQVLCFIALPQALRMMLPSLINQGIALIKDTSLAYFLQVSELMMLTYRDVGSFAYYMVEIFTFSALIYLIICASLELLGGYLQMRNQKTSH